MKFLSLLFVAVAATLSSVSAVYWDGLRVTWGPTVGNGFYDSLPRLLTDATEQGWIPLRTGGCENGGRYAGHRYRLGTDLSLNLLFDKNGIIAGIQALIPQAEAMDPENGYRYDLVPMFQNETVSGIEMLVLTAYFVDPETICTTGRTLFEFLEQGTGTGIYFQNGESITSPTIDVPSMREEAAAVGWTNCECFPGMGLHNFFEVEKWAETDCTQMQPTQATFNLDEELTGFVFQIQGPHVTSTRYETPPNEALYAIIGVDRIPQCVVDSNTKFGSSTMHIYMVDQPWLLACTK